MRSAARRVTHGTPGVPLEGHRLPFAVGWDIAQAGRLTKTIRQAWCVLPAKALELPSACVPAGMADGLPSGVLLTGARCSDLLCPDAAQIVETAACLKTSIDPH